MMPRRRRVDPALYFPCDGYGYEQVEYPTQGYGSGNPTWMVCPAVVSQWI